MSTVQVDPALLQQMVGYIGAAGKRFEKLSKEREQIRAAVPAVVDALVQHGLLATERKEAAVAALTESHARALDALQKTASKVSKEAAPPSMGKPVDSLDKNAASSAREEADKKFLSSLGF